MNQRAQKTSSIGNRGRGYRKEIEGLTAYLTNFQEELAWRTQHPEWDHNKARIPSLVTTIHTLRKMITELQSKKHKGASSLE